MSLGLRFAKGLLPTVEVVYATTVVRDGKSVSVAAPLHRSRALTQQRALLKAQAWAKANTTTR